MGRAKLLPLLMAVAIGGGATEASAQAVTPADAAPAADAAAAEAPRSFTSAAQARTYLAQNPTGARAEQAFRTTVDADLAVQNPELDPAQIRLGSALNITPGAMVTPEQVEAVINATTPDIGARKGWF